MPSLTSLGPEPLFPPVPLIARLYTFRVHSGRESSGGTRTQESIWVPDHGAAAGGEAGVASTVQRHTVTAGQHDSPPPSDRTVAAGQAAEQECLERLGLPPAVVCTIHGARTLAATAS